jgi:hypothetical protein
MFGSLCEFLLLGPDGRAEKPVDEEEDDDGRYAGG